MPSDCFQISNNTASPIKVNLNLLSVHVKFLNFSANSLKGLTSKREDDMVIINKPV